MADNSSTSNMVAGFLIFAAIVGVLVWAAVAADGSVTIAEWGTGRLTVPVRTLIGATVLAWLWRRR